MSNKPLINIKKIAGVKNDVDILISKVSPEIDICTYTWKAVLVWSHHLIAFQIELALKKREEKKHPRFIINL